MSGTQTLYAIPTPFTPGGRSYLIKILNTASVNALRPGMMKGIYSISKAAVVNTTKALAKECSTLGICVNALVPGLKHHICWRVVWAGRDIQTRNGIDTDGAPCHCKFCWPGGQCWGCLQALRPDNEQM